MESSPLVLPTVGDGGPALTFNVNAFGAELPAETTEKPLPI